MPKLLRELLGRPHLAHDRTRHNSVILFSCLPRSQSLLLFPPRTSNRVLITLTLNTRLTTAKQRGVGEGKAPNRKQHQRMLKTIQLTQSSEPSIRKRMKYGRRLMRRVCRSYLEDLIARYGKHGIERKILNSLGSIDAQLEELQTDATVGWDLIRIV
jgi:hypothetical protein